MLEAAEDYVYFVHSYYAPVGDYTIAQASYPAGVPFSAGVRYRNFYGVAVSRGEKRSGGRTNSAQFSDGRPSLNFNQVLIIEQAQYVYLFYPNEYNPGN